CGWKSPWGSGEARIYAPRSELQVKTCPFAQGCGALSTARYFRGLDVPQSGGSEPPKRASAGLRRIESRPGRFDAGEIVLGPGPDTAERFAEAVAEIGELVFDSRRDHRVDGALDQTVALHLPQRLGQHLLADTRDLAADLGEAQRSVIGEDFENQHSPLVGNLADHVVDEFVHAGIAVRPRLRRRHAHGHSPNGKYKSFRCLLPASEYRNKWAAINREGDGP